MSYVYFIQAGPDGHGPVKIGTAANPRQRLLELQTGAHEPLTLIGQVPGGKTEEREMHKTFAGQHLRGEGNNVLDAPGSGRQDADRGRP